MANNSYYSFYHMSSHFWFTLFSGLMLKGSYFNKNWQWTVCQKHISCWFNSKIIKYSSFNNQAALETAVMMCRTRCSCRFKLSELTVLQGNIHMHFGASCSRSLTIKWWVYKICSSLIWYSRNFFAWGHREEMGWAHPETEQNHRAHLSSKR